MELEKSLHLLDEANARLYQLLSEKDRLERAVITDAQREQISAINEELGPDIAMAQEAIKNIKEEVKRQVVAIGETVKSKAFTVVYVKPKRRWESNMLEGLFAARPELDINMYSKKVGGTVQFREI